MKNEIVMQVQPSDSLRSAIGEMQVEMQSKGYPGRARSLTALYVRCVEAGVGLFYECANINQSLPSPVDYAPGPKKINIKFAQETRMEIYKIAGRDIPDRDMVNILAYWGLPSVTQYVHALTYVDAPKPKQGRPRKEKHDLVS